MTTINVLCWNHEYVGKSKVMLPLTITPVAGTCPYKPYVHNPNLYPDP